MRAKPFLIGFFVVVAAVAAVSIYVNQSVEKTGKAYSAVASPNGKYKAVRVTLARGGAEPFCFDIISVFLSVYPDDFAERNKTYEVYRAPCAPPAERAALPKIDWRSNTDLRITYAPASAGNEKHKLETKAMDASNFVRVTAVPQH